MKSQNGGITVRQATLDEIFQVRWDVLRPARPRAAAQFPGDDDSRTIHCGAFEDATGLNIACATLTRVDWQGEPAWQLRGMGVIQAYQGRGVGKLVLEVLEELAGAASPIRLFWCNAREEAVDFYKKRGWSIASARFHIEDVGPHYKMTRRFGA
jgi:GNAT superfamily N-acetyltransferase